MKYPKTTLTDTLRVSDRNFYKNDVNVSNYRNMMYYVEIALENYLAKVFLKNNLDRIIWSNSDYALRKRGANANDNPLETLDLPFLNYIVTDTNNDTERQLFNNYMNVNGIYLPEAEVVVKTAPLHLEYESTLWFNRDEELVYATHRLLFENSNETIIYPVIPLDNGKSIKLPAFVKFSISYNDIYSQSDYIISNKIRTLTINYSIDTYLLKEVGNTVNTNGTGSSDIVNIPLTESIIFDFFNSKNINTTDMYNSEMEVLLRNYFSVDTESHEELLPPVTAPV